MKSSSPVPFLSIHAALIGLFGLCAASQSSAQQVPDRMNYQGMLRKGDGTPEAAGYKDIEFRIYDAATAGNVLWARSHRVNLDENGLFNVVLMEGGSSLTGARYTNLLSVFTDTSGEGRYLELKVQGSNPIQPRQKFVTTAYAFLAADVTQAKQNFTVAGNMTVQNSTHVGSLTVDAASTLNSGYFTGNVGIGALPTTNALTVNGDVMIGTHSADYQRLGIGGGNSWGFLYGGYALLGDGIHLGYNYYVDSAGVGKVHATGGQTSRLSLGYGRIQLATAGVNTPPVNRMIVDQNGNVGIGAASPARLLQVGDANVPNSQGMIRLGSRSGNSADAATWDIGAPETDNILNVGGYDFVIDDPERGTNAEFIISRTSGRVGITCASPARALQIGDSRSPSEGMIRLGSRSPDGTSYRAWDVGPAMKDPALGGYSFVIDDIFTTNTTEFIVHFENGNVGIGTNNPASKLHLVGSMRITGLATGTGVAMRYDATTGLVTRDSSSRRYKDNIKPLATDWSGLMKAQPVSYTRPGSPDVREVGFIAEDFDALDLGALVVYDASGRPDGIQYDRITVWLLEIAKAQQKELAEKAARLQSLEQSVADLKAMVNALAEKANSSAR